MLLLLRMTAGRMTDIAPFLLAIGRQLLLLSIAVPGLPSLHDQPAPDEEEMYLAEVNHILERL